MLFTSCGAPWYGIQQRSTETAERGIEESVSDLRVASTEQLAGIARACDIHTYDARLKPELLSQLEPAGYHVLILTTRHHRDGRHTVAHHRTRALLKVQGSPDPVIVSLDVAVSRWDDLPTAEDALRAQGLLSELNR